MKDSSQWSGREGGRRRDPGEGKGGDGDDYCRFMARVQYGPVAVFKCPRCALTSLAASHRNVEMLNGRVVFVSAMQRRQRGVEGGASLVPPTPFFHCIW